MASIENVRRFLWARRSSLVLACFVVVIAWVYWPALWHIARGDQVGYLAEMSIQKNWTDVVFGSYDQTRTREFNPGEGFFFRPLFYVFLGTEVVLFGHRFWMWQTTGLLLHLFAVWALYRLLRAVRPGIGAAVIAGSFGLLLTSQEAVVWHHINSYVLFGALALLAFERVYRYILSEGKKPVLLYIAFGLMAAEVFLYEAGIVYCLCLGLILLVRPVSRREFRPALGFLGLIVLYATFSILDFVLRGMTLSHLAPESQPGLGQGVQTIWNFILALKWNIFSGFFLRIPDLMPASRMMVPDAVFEWGWPFTAWSPEIAWRTVVLTAFVLTAALSLLWARRKIAPARLTLGILLLGLLTAYVGMNSFGRMNTRGFHMSFGVSLYYLYNFWMLWLAFFYVVCDGWQGFQGIWKKGLLLVFLGIWLVHAGWNANDVRAMNVTMKYDHTSGRTLVELVDRFVAQHGKEPDFSLYIAPDVPGNYVASWLLRKGDPPGYTYSFAGALYLNYFKDRDAKYQILRAPAQ